MSTESLSPSRAGAAERHWRRTRQSRIPLPSLGLRYSERKLLLMAVDVVLLCAALIMAVKLRTEWLDSPGAVFAVWRWYVSLAVTWWVIAQVMDSYDLMRAASAPHSIINAVTAAALTVIVYQFIPVVTPPLASRKLVLLFGLMAGGALLLWRGLYAVVFVQPNFQQRALVLGAGWAGRTLATALQSQQAESAENPLRGTGYYIVGFVDDDPAKRAAGSVAGVPVVGASEDLPQLIQELEVDEVVLAITHRHTMSDAAFEAFLRCQELGYRVTTMPVLYERLLGRVPVEHVGRTLHAVLPLDEMGPTERLYRVVKRFGDVTGSLLGLVAMGLLVPLVAVGNALTSPGPLFYRQERVGKGGRTFKVIKFRTMCPNAEQETGAVWACRSDPRVTPVGRWLRKTRLDELPQVINVLRGEMSLVGPRPERPEFVERLSREIPFYRARHAVWPGLTGWAQVRYGYGSSVEDARIKLEYDLYYVRHAGFYLDALILLKTAAVVLRMQGH